MSALSRRVHQPFIIWGAAVFWTALVIFLMLSRGEESLADDLSASAGGSDLSDAVGHVILFGILALLWQHVYRHYYPERTSLYVTIVSIAAGIGLELAQFSVPHRGVTLLDASANVLGVVGCWLLLRTQAHRIL